MKTEEKESSIAGAMAFYHEKGLVPSLKQAKLFARKNGRVGVGPDVINARIGTELGQTPWETYFTTLTAEYMGVSKGGSKILIVAHGIGPMATLDGILKAYKHEYDDKTCSCRGGRISKKEFLKLESGQYGEVSIIDFDKLNRRYQYPLIGILTMEEALKEPLIHARFGPNWEKYVIKHAKAATEWHKKRKHGLINNPYIIQMEDASNCSYFYAKLEDNLALAHLISFGQLTHTHHGGKQSLVSDVSCHEWSNGVRFIGIQGNGNISNIHEGINNISKTRDRFWKKLMKPTSKLISSEGFYALMTIDAKTSFTQYSKKGESMDNYEPEFRVTSMKPIDNRIIFTTTIGGHRMHVKYGIKEVQQIAPMKANAYSVIGNPWIISDLKGNPTRHGMLIQFYHVEIDTSKRLMQTKDIRNNFNLMLDLVKAQESA